MARRLEKLNIEVAHTYTLRKYISLLSPVISASRWTPSESHNVYRFSKAPSWWSWAPLNESVSGPLKSCFCNNDSLAVFSEIFFFFFNSNVLISVSAKLVAGVPLLFLCIDHFKTRNWTAFNKTACFVWNDSQISYNV